MNEDALKKITRDVILETLVSLGFDLASPHKTQNDLMFLRKLRQNHEFTIQAIKTSSIAVIISALFYSLWEGVKTLLP